MANETFVWGFMNESAATLQTMGWGVSSTNVGDIVQSNTYQNKPAGAPANYSILMDGDDSLKLPSVAKPSVAHGSISTTMRLIPGASPATRTILQAYDANGDDSVFIHMRTSGAIDLFVDDTYKSTSAEAYNWQSFQFVTLFYDFSSSTNRGKIEVNGVVSNAEASDLNTSSPTAPANIDFFIRGGANTDRATAHAQVIVREDYASAAPVRFVTVVQVDSDVSETGTWTPDTGSDNFARINGTYDASSFCEESSPSANDKVVCGLTANLASKLGFAASTIDAVCTIAVSTGIGQTGRAAVGDGSAVTNGATGDIGSSATMSVAVATTKPSGGAWASTDTPQASYEVVTV